MALARNAVKRLLSITTHPSPPLSLPRTRFTSIRRFSESNGDGNGPRSMVSTLGNWGLTQTAALFPGMDYKHWFVHMVEPGGEGATKQQIIDCYIKTLAKVVGSEEEAKKRIYKVNCVPMKTHLGFGCKLDWETAGQLEDLPGVACISADCYRDSEYKDYGGELFVNGKIVERSPERERRLQMSPRLRWENLR